ncbi:hypothetical protein MTO96_041606 [Rhipicephalus appendiculatus]
MQAHKKAQGMEQRLLTEQDPWGSASHEVSWGHWDKTLSSGKQENQQRRALCVCVIQAVATLFTLPVCSTYLLDQGR